MNLQDDIEELFKLLTGIGVVLGLMWGGAKFVFNRGQGFAEINAQIAANRDAIASLVNMIKEEGERREEHEREYRAWREKLDEHRAKMEANALNQSTRLANVETTLRLIHNND